MFLYFVYLLINSLICLYINLANWFLRFFSRLILFCFAFHFMLFMRFICFVFSQILVCLTFVSLLCAFYTGHVIKSYSNISDTATKTKYNRNMVKPNPLFMRQRKQAIESTTNTSIINKMVMEQTMPTEFTSTGAS